MRAKWLTWKGETTHQEGRIDPGQIPSKGEPTRGERVKRAKRPDAYWTLLSETPSFSYNSPLVNQKPVCYFKSKYPVNMTDEEWLQVLEKKVQVLKLFTSLVRAYGRGKGGCTFATVKCLLWLLEKSYPGEIVPKRNRTQIEWVRFLQRNRTHWSWVRFLLGTISPGYDFSWHLYYWL